jgi:hypothetical protein
MGRKTVNPDRCHQAGPGAKLIRAAFSGQEDVPDDQLVFCGIFPAVIYIWPPHMENIP